MEEKRIKHYSSGHSILLVGEGDFSFSACLADAFGMASNMTATSLDSKESLVREYRNAMANLNKLESLGCTVLHEVDVHMMKDHPRLLYRSFDFFLREHDIIQIMKHQDVVRGFFRNAKNMIHNCGEIHLTHKTAYPFCQWEIVKLAEKEGLQLVEEAPFYIWQYPGYVNERRWIKM